MRIALPLLVVLAAVTLSPAAPAQTSQPAATAAAGEGEALLSRVAGAYRGLASLRLAATTTADYAAGGRTIRAEVASTAALDAEGRLRLDLPGELAVAATADAVFVSLPASLRFYKIDREPGEPLTPATLGPAATEAMTNADLSLLLAAVEDPAVLLQSLGRIAPGDNALVITRPDGSVWTLAFDPQTALLASVEIDESAALREAGVPDVERAIRRTTYTKVEPDADVPAEAVAFAPPAEAQQVEAGGPLAGAAEGQLAPDLALPDLDGNVLSLAKLKGRVVVVDFWATWCGPCVAAVPSLKALAEARGGDGLVVLAVNLKEPAEVARQFASDNAMSGDALRVLLDADGAVAERWGVSAIPFTAVVGRDGAIRKLVVGLDPAAVEAAVESALTE